MRRRVFLYVLIGVVAVFLVVRMSSNKRISSEPRKISVSSPAKNLYKQAEKLKLKSQADALAKFEQILAEYPESLQAAMALVQIAQIHEAGNDKLKQKAALKQLVNSYLDSEPAANAKQKLWDLNISILGSPIQTEDSFVYTVQPGDSLYKIAKNHHTTVDLLMKSNSLTGSLIKPGMKLKVNKAVFKINVDKSDNILVLKTENEIVKIYNIATGKDNCTPVGTFKILTGHRIKDPVWYKTGAIVPPGSAENILGTRWLGLSEPGYGIHGTTMPDSIGTQATQGCVRMKNKEVEELFVIVPGETEVVIID
ncbi:MAG: L,D-transpeptidase family protein [PVC group bacterium]|nr:L,D-transpeptidase family protein [PVC group bacterium]